LAAHEQGLVVSVKMLADWREMQSGRNRKVGIKVGHRGLPMVGRSQVDKPSEYSGSDFAPNVFGDE
jgi:hypothetical protein